MSVRKDGPFVKRLIEALSLSQREAHKGNLVSIIPIDLASGLNPDETDCEVGKLIREHSRGAEIVLRAIPSLKFSGCLGEGKKTLSALMANLETPIWGSEEPSDWDLEVLDALNAFETDVIAKALSKKKNKIDHRARQMLCVVKPEIAGKL